MTSEAPRDTALHRFATRRRMLAAAVVVALAAVWWAGPTPGFTERWAEPEPGDDLEAWVEAREAGVPALRAGDGRAIVWADPEAPASTEVSLVYLHGFSADRHELEPVISEVAGELGANLYFARLTGHGRDSEAMADATVEDWLDDAVEALVVGERLGERVVVIGTSTGGTLATWLAARPEAAGRVAAVVLVSPNFQPKDPSSRILLRPWGVQLARLVVGPERCWEPLNQEQARHWTTCYPTPVLGTMMALVERVRTMDLSGVRQPVLAVYSPDDQVVEAAQTRERIGAMSNADVQVVQFNASTDPDDHVLAGDIVSPESNDAMRALLVSFLAPLRPRSGSGGSG